MVDDGLANSAGDITPAGDNGDLDGGHAGPDDVANDLGPVVSIPIGRLRPADSPRRAGVDPRHVRTLNQANAALPPITVHAPTMRVIDGMHRLRVAALQGAQTIEARLFDGGDESAFILAVESNVRHGLPLPLVDREKAAVRILQSCPSWSNRAVARVTGLAPTTIGVIRAGTGGDAGLPRVGCDGRVRPLDVAEGRRRAGAMLAEQPTASLREVARAVGISPATVRDVRNRVRRGEDPALTHRTTASIGGAALQDIPSMLGNLARDPSLRFSEPGRALLQWLHRHAAGLRARDNFVCTIPPHCSYTVAELARSYAAEWLTFADRLEQETRVSAADSGTQVPPVHAAPC